MYNLGNGKSVGNRLIGIVFHLNTYNHFGFKWVKQIRTLKPSRKK